MSDRRALRLAFDVDFIGHVSQPLKRIGELPLASGTFAYEPINQGREHHGVRQRQDGLERVERGGCNAGKERANNNFRNCGELLG